MYELEKKLSLFARLKPVEDETTEATLVYFTDPAHSDELDAFIHSAAQHGVPEIVVRNLSAYCTEKGVQVPHQLVRAKAFLNILKLRNSFGDAWLRTLDEAFAEYGIKAVRLKGLSYIHHTYKDPTLRSSCDTDLLIQNADLLEAERILRTCASSAGLQVASSLEDQSIAGYRNEDNSHYACFTVFHPTKLGKCTVEFHKDVEFLSPMQLRPVYDHAIMKDERWLTSPLDTLLVACNHAWNHFPYSFHDFYYHPAILRLYMDVLETYHAVRAMGFSDDDIWERAQACRAQDVVGNAFLWTKSVYAAPYERSEEEPNIRLPDFLQRSFSVYPCDLCSSRLSSKFVDQLFGRDQERARVVGLYLKWRQEHSEVSSEIRVDNQFGHDDFFDRYLTRSFCFESPKVSSTLQIKRFKDHMTLFIQVYGLFSGDALGDNNQLDGNRSYITVAFLGNSFRAFHFQMGASGLYAMIQYQNDGALIPFPQAELTYNKIKSDGYQIEWNVPNTILPDEAELRFDYQLHWRGGGLEQVQDMSWGGGMLGGTFYNMLEDCRDYLPIVKTRPNKE